MISDGETFQQNRRCSYSCELAGEWTALNPLPVARGDAAMTTIPSQFGDRLIVLGGETEVPYNSMSHHTLLL